MGAHNTHLNSIWFFDFTNIYINKGLTHISEKKFVQIVPLSYAISHWNIIYKPKSDNTFWSPLIPNTWISVLMADFFLKISVTVCNNKIQRAYLSENKLHLCQKWVNLLTAWSYQRLASCGKVKETVLENRRVGIREVAEDLNISYGSTQHISLNVLGMKHGNTRLVPKLVVTRWSLWTWRRNWLIQRMVL